MIKNIKKELLVLPMMALLLSGCFGSSDSDDDTTDTDTDVAACTTDAPTTVLNLVLPEIVYTKVIETSDPNDTGATAQAIDSNTIVTGSVVHGSDYEDTYVLSVSEGDKLEFILSNVAGGSPRTIFLYFYNDPVFGGETSVGEVESADPEKRFEYTVPAGMDNLYVWVQAYAGSGAYTLTVTTPQEPVLIETEIVGEECKANLQGSLSDAVDASKTITDATISLRKGTDVKTGLADETVNVDAQGNYSFTEIAAGDYTIEVSGDGYITVYENITLAAEKTAEKRFSLSPTLPTGQIRLVMSWGATPSILDSHLHGPNASSGTFLINWRARSASNVSLDRDAMQGYGPETITIATRNTGTYTYWINDYSNRNNNASTALAESGATVSVYTDQGLFATYEVPSGAGTRWNVLTINSEGVITPVNTLSLWSEQL